MALNLIQKKKAEDERIKKIESQAYETNLISIADFLAANYTQTEIGQRHFPGAKRTRPHLIANGCSLPIQKTVGRLVSNSECYRNSFLPFYQKGR